MPGEIAKRPARFYLKESEAHGRPDGRWADCEKPVAAKEGRGTRMFKTLVRLVSMVLLAVAVIMAVLDATRSIAAGSVVMTPLGASWMGVSPQSLAGFKDLVEANLPALFWDPVVLALLGLPGFAVFGGLSLLAALAGRKRERRIRRRFAM